MQVHDRRRRGRARRRPAAMRDARSLAVVAIAFAALALRLVLPAHAAFASPTPGGALLPFCTAQGIVWKALPNPDPEPPLAPASSAPPRCPLCLATGAMLADSAAAPALARRGDGFRICTALPARVVDHTPNGVIPARGPPTPA